ncbi:MAG: sulfotransferase [Bacteroidales bacterium]
MKAGRFIFHQYSKLMHFYYHQLRASSYLKQHDSSFREIKAFTLFIGYPRSGHTLLGSMLNAHPDMLIAHEYHALKKMDHHSSREALFAHLIAQDHWFSSRGNKWTGYCYRIPTGWQNSYRRLRIIGDKRGGASSRILFHEPERLDRLQSMVELPLKIIIVHRNPFDNIATRARGGNYYQKKPDTRRVDEEILKYFRDAQVIDNVKHSTDHEFIELTHEDFIKDPAKHITEICNFLGIPPLEDYVTTCAKAIRPANTLSRNKISWTESQIDQIKKKSSRYDFLKDYTFEQ